MIDTQTLQVLQDIILRESRSVLQYIREAYPWTTSGNLDTLEQVRAIIEEEHEAIGRLVRYVLRQRGSLPYPGSYPSGFTTLNFVSLEHLLPRLIQYEEQSRSELQGSLPSLNNDEARHLVQEFKELKAQHLKTLKQLHTPAREPAVME